jgi:hypothetical protein
VDLYILILEKVVLSRTEEIPVNKKGIYCSEAGETTFLDISREIRQEDKSLDVFETDTVKCLSFQDRTQILGLDEAAVELAFASK